MDLICFIGPNIQQYFAGEISFEDSNITSISSAACKDQPKEAESPHHVAARIPEPGKLDTTKEKIQNRPLKSCINPRLQLRVVRTIHDSKEEAEEKLPKHQIHDWRDVDLASFGDMQHISAEQAHDVALVSDTPRREALGKCLGNVCEAVLLSVPRVKYAVETAEYAGKVIFQ